MPLRQFPPGRNLTGMIHNPIPLLLAIDYKVVNQAGQQVQQFLADFIVRQLPLELFDGFNQCGLLFGAGVVGPELGETGQGLFDILKS